VALGAHISQPDVALGAHISQPDVALGAHITTIEEDRDIMDAKAVFKSIFPLSEEDISYTMKEFCPSLLSKQFVRF